MRKFRAGNYSIENVVAGSEASESAESIFAALPEEFALSVVAGNADFAGVMGFAHFSDSRCLVRDSFGEAFDFEKENRSSIARESSVNEILDNSKSPAVEHFASRGSDGSGGDIDDRFRGVIDGIENGEKRPNGFRLAGKLYGDFGNEGKCAFGANEKGSEIVAPRVAVLAADSDDFAIRENEFEGGDVIAGDAVRKGVWAAGIFCDVAADCAGFLARRIRSEVQSVRFGRESEVKIDDAGLDNRAVIFSVKSENAIHARKNDHHAAGARERATGEPGPGTAADDGNVMLPGKLDDARNMFG